VAALPGRGSAAAAHPRPQERQRLDRPDERVPFDQLALDPEQPVELARVVGPEPAVKDEVLRDGDRGDGVELQEPQPPDRVEDAVRRSVQELRADGDPAGLLDADLTRAGRLVLRHREEPVHVDAAVTGGAGVHDPDGVDRIVRPAPPRPGELDPPKPDRRRVRRDSRDLAPVHEDPGEPCVGPTVVIHASVRTFAEKVAAAPFLVETWSDPPSARAAVWVLQAPVYVASESGGSPKFDTKEGAFVNALPT
jgi:hypothetical protein